MRDHTKLTAFQLAHQLVLEVYRCTSNFPGTERFGLTNQLRRAAVSISSNIVEGCARSTLKDYLHFLSIAYGSSKEVEYQLSLAHDLGYLPNEPYEAILAKSSEVCRVLNGLMLSLKNRL